MKQLFLTIFSVLLLFGCSEEDKTHNWNNETNGILPIVFIRDEENTDPNLKESTFVTGIYQSNSLDPKDMMYETSKKVNDTYLVVYYIYRDENTILSNPTNGIEYYAVSAGIDLTDPDFPPEEILYFLTASVSGNTYYNDIRRENMQDSSSFSSFVATSEGVTDTTLTSYLKDRLVLSMTNDFFRDMIGDNFLILIYSGSDYLSVNFDNFSMGENNIQRNYLYKDEKITLQYIINYIPNAKNYNVVDINGANKVLKIDRAHILIRYSKYPTRYYIN